MAIRNYLKVFADGHTEATKHKPLFQEGERERAYAGENPDVLVDGKWWNSTNGDNLVTNGDFSDGTTTGWTASGTLGGTAILTYQNGSMNITSGGVQGYDQATQTIATEIGKKYTIRYLVSVIIGLFDLFIDNALDTTESSATGQFEHTFIATSTNTDINFRVATTASSLTIDNIEVYETEIVPDTEYPTQFTYMAKDDKLASFLIEDGQPVDITYEYDAPSIVQNVVQAGKFIWTDYESQMKFLQSDGIDYDDPDAIGANPVAKIYPDGTIVGSTDLGIYTKYPNGDLICRFNKTASSTTAIGNIFRGSTGSVLFPVEYVGALQVTFGTTNNSTTTWGGAAGATTTLGFTGYIYSATAGASGALSWTAIGRWK